MKLTLQQIKEFLIRKRMSRRKITLQQIKEIVEEIKRTTTMEAYSLTICPDKKPDILDSKFGGLPYWDCSKLYPTDSNGNPLILLAQINFEKFHPEPPLPERGMLQFFIGADDAYGLDIEHPNVQDTFRVVYHETLDTSISRADIEQMNFPDNTKKEWEDATPLLGEWAVECEKQICCLNMIDMRFAALEKIYGIYGKDMEKDFFHELPDEELRDALEKEINANASEYGGHWILGHPSFIQNYDPRDFNEAYEKYDTLLFQMDSDFDHAQCNYVLWGDAGTGNFFISREDLERRDFSDILYHADCL